MFFDFLPSFLVLGYFFGFIYIYLSVGVGEMLSEVFDLLIYISLVAYFVFKKKTLAFIWNI